MHNDKCKCEVMIFVKKRSKWVMGDGWWVMGGG